MANPRAERPLSGAPCCGAPIPTSRSHDLLAALEPVPNDEPESRGLWRNPWRTRRADSGRWRSRDGTVRFDPERASTCPIWVGLNASNSGDRSSSTTALWQSQARFPSLPPPGSGPSGPAGYGSLIQRWRSRQGGVADLRTRPPGRSEAGFCPSPQRRPVGRSLGAARVRGRVHPKNPVVC